MINHRARNTGRKTKSQSGTATVETALVATLLLFVFLGVVEFGNAISIDHTITSLSREGANIAARGSTLSQAIQTVSDNGISIELPSRGGVIGTRLVVTGGVPTVEDQAASAGYASASRIGAVGDPVPSLATLGLQEGQQIHVVEVFYNYQRMTPLGNLISMIPNTLYTRAVF